MFYNVPSLVYTIHGVFHKVAKVLYSIAIDTDSFNFRDSEIGLETAIKLVHDMSTKHCHIL